MLQYVLGYADVGGTCRRCGTLHQAAPPNRLDAQGNLASLDDILHLSGGGDASGGGGRNLVEAIQKIRNLLVGGKLGPLSREEIL